MKIFQVPFCFHPDPVGGTEVYVEALATQLQQQGHEIAIVAPSLSNQTYYHQNLLIHRFALNPTPSDLRSLYGEGDKVAAQNFEALLDHEKPDLVHLHAFTAGVSIRLVRAAHQRHIPVLFTYHTPTVSCQRGTLLKQGFQICTGQVDVKTCTRCTLHGLGLANTPAHLVGSLPPAIGKSLGVMNLQGEMWTALRMSELVNCQHQAFQSLMSEADHIIAVCDWVKALLLCNQVPEEKLTVLRQGLCYPQVHSLLLEPSFQEEERGILRLVFLGRLDPVKGLHILVQSLAQLRDQPNITLDIYGISQVTESNSYQDELFSHIDADSRINIRHPLSANHVISTLAQYDLLVVPSQWLETGPLVVLEAFAAGVPVMGSCLGGIAELVEDGVNGLLVKPTSVEDWTAKIRGLCRDRSQLASLRSGISPPQDMQTVAEKMKFIYQEAISEYEL
jgi:glycosyltransferase involved in cell wall biosynthesis